MTEPLIDSLRGADSPGAQDPDLTDRVHDWPLLTRTELDRLDPDKTVVLVTCSPLEVHGPHLPMGADCFEAEAIAHRAAERMLARHRDMHVLRLPPLYVAADVVPQRGSVQFRVSTITRVLTDLGRSLAIQGFRHLWVTSFHGGPRHWLAIEVAADRVNRRWGAAMIPVFSLMISRLTGGNSDLAELLADVAGLPVDVLRGDTHAGTVETAMLLHLLGDRVDPRFGELPRRTVSRKLRELGVRPIADRGHPGLAELLRGFYYKLKYFEKDSYAGDPRHASADMGERLLDHLANLSAEALEEVWAGRLPPERCHSPLWPLRWLFTNETLSWLVERAVGYRNRVF